MEPGIDWNEITNCADWDSELARLGGHPLQSVLWGEARKQAEGVDYRCYIATSAGSVVAMARVENRNIPLLGTVAWMPRGPVTAEPAALLPALENRLRKAGCIVAVCTPWLAATQQDNTINDSTALRTIWIDLAVGKDRLLENLDSQWRYGARRAVRDGVVIEQTRASQDVSTFYDLCMAISAAKGFRLPASLPLMNKLLALSEPQAAVQARLFAARYADQLIAGVFVLKAGNHIHYLWGGVDRAHAKLRAGEAVQWAVMEWAVEQGCTLYDLEGIDPVNNPGTYQFKKKMGGREVTLQKMLVHSLGLRGTLILPLIKRRL